MHQEVKIFPTTEELNNFAAEKFVEMAKRALKKRKRFVVALAGGSTPKSLYQLLSSDKFKDKIDWTKVFFFFGDERNVLPDDEESNFRMANENLFEPLQISSENIFRWPTEFQNAKETAEIYEQTVVGFFDLKAKLRAPADGSNLLPRFDLILLGMGADGHTASLFPFSEALRETEKIAVSTSVEKLRTTRLTLTLPAINTAANIIFLVSGAEKAEALREVLEGDPEEDEKFPARMVKPADGRLFWLIDKNVAKLLQNNGNSI